MINEVIRGIIKGEIKPSKGNRIAFGRYEYPKTFKQAWQQAKREIWQKE